MMKKLWYLDLFLFVGCTTNIDVYQYHLKRVSEFSLDNNKYDIVFMGDSITEGGRFESVIEGSKNVGIGGDRIYSTEDLIPCVVKYEPSKIYLLIGINSLYYYSVEECKAQYEHLISLMVASFPNTQITLETVLPTLVFNPKISEFNVFVKETAYRYNLSVLDLYSMYEVNDRLPEDITLDGLHLTTEGYNVWYEALKE